MLRQNHFALTPAISSRGVSTLQRFIATMTGAVVPGVIIFIGGSEDVVVHRSQLIGHCPRAVALTRRVAQVSTGALRQGKPALAKRGTG